MTQATQPGRLNAFAGIDSPFPPLDMSSVVTTALRGLRRWRVEFTDQAGAPLVWSGTASDSLGAIRRAGGELAGQFPGFTLETARVVVCVEVQ